MNTTYTPAPAAPPPLQRRPVLPAIALLVATAALALSTITITKIDIGPSAPHPPTVASQSQAVSVSARRSTGRNLDDCGRPITRESRACQ